MLFNSLIFLFAFLPVAYGVFWLLRSTRQRHVWLTITGYIFYGYWDPRFCLLMAFTTLVSFSAGLGFLGTEDPKKRKWLLITPIAVDLSLLGYFKYADFLAESLNGVFDLVGWPMMFPILDVILPVGISFYTFHTITYIVDSYKGVIKPTRNLWEFGAYVSLFSQLVAGPIVRFREIEKDLENVALASRQAGLWLGLSFLAFGMFEKVCIADSLAHFVDPMFDRFEYLSTLGTWLAVLGYTFQLYFDFSGYSTMSCGLGLMFGIKIPRNFFSPYRSLNPSEFWTRWHISLSTVMRDYIYIPLGGNRFGNLMRYRNLMITMLIGGLWHGANWTFVIWGGYHGLLLLAYHWLSLRNLSLPKLPSFAVTFLAVVIGWVMFRAPDVCSALSIFRAMFVPTPGEVTANTALFATLIAVAFPLATLAPNAFEFHSDFHDGYASRARTAVVLGVGIAVIAGARESPFLYFQF